jgi:hypothetical protein
MHKPSSAEIGHFHPLIVSIYKKTPLSWKFQLKSIYLKGCDF